MKMMKKILVCALAVMLILALTACAGKCAYCEKHIEGKGYKYDGKVYCDEQCAGDAGMKSFLEGIMPEENKD